MLSYADAFWRRIRKQEATMQMERALATAAAAKQASWAGGQAASKPMSLAEIQALVAQCLIP